MADLLVPGEGGWKWHEAKGAGALLCKKEEPPDTAAPLEEDGYKPVPPETLRFLLN
jgi:hypothetical protein